MNALLIITIDYSIDNSVCQSIELESSTRSSKAKFNSCFRLDSSSQQEWNIAKCLQNICQYALPHLKSSSTTIIALTLHFQLRTLQNRYPTLQVVQGGVLPQGLGWKKSYMSPTFTTCYQGDVLLFLDADTEIQSSGIAHLIEHRRIRATTV